MALEHAKIQASLVSPRRANVLGVALAEWVMATAVLLTIALVAVTAVKGEPVAVDSVATFEPS